METIIEEIKAELEVARSKWGVEFDNHNTANDWIAYVAAYAWRGLTYPVDPARFRRAMIEAAGLCISAAEAFDRNGGTPETHYSGPNGTKPARKD